MYRKNIPKILGLLLLLALLGCSRSFVLEPVRESQQSDSGVLSDGKRFSEEARPEKIREAKPEQKPYKHFKHKAWAVLAGNPESTSDKGQSIVVDKAGNSYVMGSLGGKAKFGKVGVKVGRAGELFIAKLDRNGKFVWVVMGGCRWGHRELSLDHKGFLYAVGDCFFPKMGKFGDRDFSFREEKEIYRGFAAKLDSKGHVLWFRTGSNVNWRAHVLDRKGNLYVAGSFWDETELGKVRLKVKGFLLKRCKKDSDCPYNRECTNLFDPKWKCERSLDMLLVKINPKGELLWVKQFGGNYLDGAEDLAIDKDGVLYMAGQIGGASKDPKVEEKRKVKMGKYNVKPGYFLAKLNPKGEVIWLRSEKGLHFISIKVDQNKNVYLTGDFEGKIDGIEKKWGGGTLFKMGADGKLIWAIPGGGYMTLNKKGELYLTGYFERRATFGKHVVYTYGSKLCKSTKECEKDESCVEGKCIEKKCLLETSICVDDSISVRKVSPSGETLWAFSFGSKWYDRVYGIALDGLGNIFVTGKLGGKGGAIGDFDFTSASDKEAINQIFIAKFLAR